MGKAAWMDFYLCKDGNGNFQKYRKTKEATEHYTFLGWFKVNADGTAESMPYNFSDPLTADLSLRALWRLDGAYTIYYQPKYVKKDNTVITLRP